MPNMILEVVIPIITIVASVIGLMYLFFFSYTVYKRLTREEHQREWLVKSNFYIGIGLFLISNIILAITRLSPNIVLTDTAIAINFLSLLIFVYAIHERMKIEAQMEYATYKQQREFKTKKKRLI